VDRITVLQAVGIGVVLSIGILSIAFALFARNVDTKCHSRSGLLASFFNARLCQCSFFLIGVGVANVSTPLDDQMGAGHLNVRRAIQQFAPGEYGPGVVPRIGWDYGSIGGQEATVEYVLLPIEVSQV
jgi:hypothetical protein